MKASEAKVSAVQLGYESTGITMQVLLSYE